MSPAPPRRRRALAPLAVAAALVVGAAAAVGLGSGSSSPSGAPRAPAADTASDLPAPVRPAFTPGKPIALSSRAVAHWAPVVRPVTARREPDAEAAAVGTLETVTPEGTTNLVLTVARATDAAGNVWVRARLPILPTNTTGWIPRSALGRYVPVRTHLVVDLDEFRATLYRDGREIFSADVGVGQEAWPTPAGRFYIRNKLTRYASPVYGPLAFGTSARSPTLTDWPAGGFVGIHGTNQPEILPGQVSHGCIRMRNPDILRLAALMPVGTPLTIQ
jgi:lipoprotein-anchoring transpeptidase ErfK/SrfK